MNDRGRTLATMTVVAVVGMSLAILGWEIWTADTAAVVQQTGEAISESGQRSTLGWTGTLLAVGWIAVALVVGFSDTRESTGLHAVTG